MSEIDDLKRTLKAACDTFLNHGGGLAPQPSSCLDEELDWLRVTNAAIREISVRLEVALAGESAALEELAEANEARIVSDENQCSRLRLLCEAVERGFGVACIEPFDLEHEIRRGAERLRVALDRITELEAKLERLQEAYDEVCTAEGYPRFDAYPPRER